MRMVDKKTVLVKTAKGVDEIVSRFYKLPSRLRSILIMVDGAATVEAIAGKAAALGGNEQSLAELIQQGFVEESGNAASQRTLPPRTLPPRTLNPERTQPPRTMPPFVSTRRSLSDPTLPPSQSREQREPARVVSIQEIKRSVVSMMYDALGPSADDLNRKVEQCKSRDELVRQVRLCFEVLRGAVGPKTAEDFRSKCDALLR